jgi:hypothetical protein
MTGCPHDGQDLAALGTARPVVRIMHLVPATVRSSRWPSARRARPPAHRAAARARRGEDLSLARAYPELLRPIAESGVAP